MYLTKKECKKEQRELALKRKYIHARIQLIFALHFFFWSVVFGLGFTAIHYGLLFFWKIDIHELIMLAAFLLCPIMLSIPFTNRRKKNIAEYIFTSFFAYFVNKKLKPVLMEKEWIFVKNITFPLKLKPQNKALIYQRINWNIKKPKWWILKTYCFLKKCNRQYWFNLLSWRSKAKKEQVEQKIEKQLHQYFSKIKIIRERKIYGK